VIRLDGAEGEGGGQIVRTALGLSLLTGQPFAIERIRANRDRPGLRRQHLAAVEAAARIGGAEVDGARPGSDRLVFRPGAVRPGAYEFAIGTAGSTTLLLQAVLPPLLVAAEPTTLTLHGGTHNPLAPPFEFLEAAFAPVLRAMGARLELTLLRPGSFPAGGGALRARIEPAARLAPWEGLERGRVRRRLATATVAHLAVSIAERELAVVAKRLGWSRKELVAREAPESDGPGNVLTLRVDAEHAAEVATGFGRIGLPAERVAERAARDLRRYLDARVPVGEHLADQLLVPLAMAGGGAFRTLPPSSHTRTNARVIERFLPVRITLDEDAGGCLVRVRPA